MPTDLNILKKAFANVAATYETTKPWDEPLVRRASVEVDQSFAAPTLPGDVGGWVASGGFPYATVVNATSSVDPVQTGVVAPARRYFETNPGRAGYSDVDFAPYNWGTNRFGNKGGALLGHPISWEVVGPTSKSPFTHWQWVLDSTNNALILEPGVLTTTFVGAAIAPTVQDGYGLDPAGLPAYNGGLYALVTLASSLTGLLDGGRSPSLPLPDYANTYQFELFRVEGWAGQSLFLEMAKPLTDYFTEPALGTSAVRAITLVRPKVTRLATFPLYNSVALQQQNQVYVVMPPERAAASEFMPPYIGAGTCPDWTVNGNFDALGTITTGVAADYGTPSPLPVPLPLTSFKAFLTATATPANQWEIQSPFAVTPLSVGQIVRVRVSRAGSITATAQSRTLGYFEVAGIAGAGPVDITLNRVPEVNSATGDVFYGAGPTGGGTDELDVDVFDNITSIFTDPTLNVAKVLASRVDHIIAPTNIVGSYQGLFEDQSIRGSTPSGPAIFDTTPDSDPGNLSNLGFRMVLFPAKSDGGNIVPDFDSPIPTNARVILDPSVTAPQYIEVDYDAGVVYLSHQPAPGAGCAVAPNGIIADPVGNPRNEVVLYAACVPYSREPSQRGPSVQIRTASVGGALGANDSVDIYGQRLVCTPTTLGALGTTLTINVPSELPSPTGWFQLGELVGGTFSTMTAPLYYSFYDSLAQTFNGIARPGAYVVTANTRMLILKSPPFVKTTYDSDGVRGSSKRSTSLNFRGTRTSVGVDGTITVSPVSTLDEAYRANDPSLPALGRTVTVDGKAIEAVPNNTAGSDAMGASFRVNTLFAPTPANLAGFDFVGNTSPITVDPFAGFIDRRVLSFSTGLSVFSPVPLCSLSGNTITLPLGEFWWTNVGGSKRSLVIPFLDLIEVNDVTYVITGFGLNPDEITVSNRDLVTVPAFPASSAAAIVFRPKFFTSRGNTGNPLSNSHSWFLGQQYGANALSEPFGALNIYAGSATSIGTGDGGGAVAALAFWSRVTASAGTGDDTLISTSYFDAAGRMVSTLNPDFMKGGALPDYTYRGDFATRRVLGTYSAVGPTYSPLTRSQPTLGHIVEDYNYLFYRYDNLSLFPLIPDLLVPSGALEYSGTSTVTTSVDGEISVTLNLPWIPFGGCVVEVTSVASDPTRIGLYRAYSGAAGGTLLYIRHLDGTVPTATEFPPGSAPEAITFRLHYINSIGKVYQDTYLDAGGSPATHTPTQIVSMGPVENDAVGIVFAGPDRRDPVLALSADRYAYRVVMSSLSGGPATPTNQETAALDIEGYHKAADYLYPSSRQISKQINLQHGQTFAGTNNPEWHWIDGSHYWQGAGNNHTLKFPLDLPRSSLRQNTAGALTHRTRLISLLVTGNFGAGVIPASVEVFKMTVNPAAPPTATALYLGPAATPITTVYSLTSGGNTDYPIGVWGDNAGTVPVYVDNTSTDYYYIRITSSNNTGTNDKLYGISVTYTDPGPRNY